MENFSVKGIFIESKIFELPKQGKSIYERMGKYRGLFVYLLLYKFRIHRQTNDHTFILSISALREETKDGLVKKGYSTEEVYEILKGLQSCGLIELKSYTRWNQLTDKETGEIQADKLIVVESTNPFPIRKLSDEEHKYFIENEIYYTYVPLNLFELFQMRGLDERYFALFLFLRKWSNSSSYNYNCRMRVKKIAKHLLISDKKISEMIKVLKANRVLCIYKTTNKFGHIEHEYSVIKGLGDKFIKLFEETNKKILSETAAEINPTLLMDDVLFDDLDDDIVPDGYYAQEVVEDDKKFFTNRPAALSSDPFGDEPPTVFN